mmetsp:Transcript_118/g.159  ORF Transcript_118/g.159 Transcript_118/m.159 type:complete len:82 (-) Transcript_118:294-539(-)
MFCLEWLTCFENIAPSEEIVALSLHSSITSVVGDGSLNFKRKPQSIYSYISVLSTPEQKRLDVSFNSTGYIYIFSPPPIGA